MIETKVVFVFYQKSCVTSYVCAAQTTRRPKGLQCVCFFEVRRAKNLCPCLFFEVRRAKNAAKVPLLHRDSTAVFAVFSSDRRLSSAPIVAIFSTAPLLHTNRRFQATTRSISVAISADFTLFQPISSTAPLQSISADFTRFLHYKDRYFFLLNNISNF